MAYGKSGGCTPITSKIKKTTKGGVVDPLLNLGSPAKMKMHSPAKVTDPRKPLEVGTTFPGTKPKAKKSARDTGVSRGSYVSRGTGGSMTPYSVKDGKGVIHGPKVDYDMAYKNRDMKTYGGMSKAEYIKEADRQTRSFYSTGKWDAPKPRKKRATVSAVTPKKTVSITTTFNPKAEVETRKITSKKEETKGKTKPTRREQASIDKKLSKAKEARAAGNVKKAERKEKRAAKKAARIAKRAKK